MTSGTLTNSDEQKPVNTPRELEATITTALEITPYDCEALKRYLLSTQWIPYRTDEAAVADAVFRFRQFYDRRDRSHLYSFPNNPRLLRLIDVWGTEQIEDWESDYANRTPGDDYDLAIRRETTKYNAVRDLFMHMAVSEARRREKAVKAS
jgi:hypothetical protein